MASRIISQETMTGSGTVHGQFVNLTPHATRKIGLLLTGDTGGATIRILGGTDLSGARVNIENPLGTHTKIEFVLGFHMVEVNSDFILMQLLSATDANLDVTMFTQSRA
jgi:hypothetical protein